MPNYLGLDSSTQSLSALVVDTDTGSVVVDEAVNFGKDLPEYASPHGFLAHDDASVKHANPLMWVAALDLLLARVKAKGFDWSRVAGVSGAGQQHGSVYLKTPLDEAPAWSGAIGLATQLEPLLSRATSPKRSAATRAWSASAVRAPSNASPARRSASFSSKSRRRTRRRARFTWSRASWPACSRTLRRRSISVTAQA
jgi:xylulokinase